MKIRALISFAALDFSLAVGNVKEVPDDIATSLINSNYAEEVVGVETATTDPTTVADEVKAAGVEDLTPADEEKTEDTEDLTPTVEETSKAKKTQKAVKANENQ